MALLLRPRFTLHCLSLPVIMANFLRLLGLYDIEALDTFGFTFSYGGHVVEWASTAFDEDLQSLKDVRLWLHARLLGHVDSVVLKKVGY